MDRMDLHRKLRKHKLTVYFDARAGRAYASQRLKFAWQAERKLKELSKHGVDVSTYSVTPLWDGSVQLMVTVPA